MSAENKIWSYDLEKGKKVGAGQMLLAEPFMLDDNFRRAVVLLCDHSVENGTVGIILNKPINLRMNDVMEGFPDYTGRIFLGGPVSTDSLMFLHTNGDIEGCNKLNEGLYWGGNFEQVKAMLQSGALNEKNIRFYLGYAGWSSDQLTEELKDNSWIIAKAEAAHIFKANEENLWHDILHSLGGVYTIMAGYPENPLLN
jgi:putative transcriptional regulator